VFGVGLPEFVVLAILALLVFGPDRLPEVARQAGRMVRTLRQMANSARQQVAEELGPEFADLDFNDLNPRRLVQKHLLDPLDADEEDDDKPARPGHRPLTEGEQPPWDVEAT
jgi:sec-independent protein translocase protein TatB